MSQVDIINREGEKNIAKLHLPSYMIRILLLVILAFISSCVWNDDDIYQTIDKVRFDKEFCYNNDGVMVFSWACVSIDEWDLFQDVALTIEWAGSDKDWRVTVIDVSTHIEYILTTEKQNISGLLHTDELWLEGEIPGWDQSTDIRLNSNFFENIWCAGWSDIVSTYIDYCENDACTMQVKFTIETTWNDLENVFFQVHGVSDPHREIINSETWSLRTWQNNYPHDLDLGSDDKTSFVLTTTYGEWGEDTHTNIHYTYNGEETQSISSWCEYFCSSWGCDEAHSSFNAAPCSCEWNVVFALWETCNKPLRVNARFSTTTGININKPVKYEIKYQNGQVATFPFTDGTINFQAEPDIDEIKVSYISSSAFGLGEKWHLQVTTTGSNDVEYELLDETVSFD